MVVTLSFAQLMSSRKSSIVSCYVNLSVCAKYTFTHASLEYKEDLLQTCKWTVEEDIPVVRRAIEELETEEELLASSPSSFIAKHLRLGGKIGRSKRLIRFVPVRSPIVTRSRSNTMESAGNNSSAPPPPNMTEYASVTELNQVNEKLDRLTQMFMNFMQNQNQSNQDHPNYILVPDQPQAPPDQPQGQANPTGPSSSTNSRSLSPKQTVIFHTSGQQEDDTYEEEEWRSKGKQKADMSDQIAQLKSELRSELRSEVRQLKGVDTYGKIDLEDLCLHPGSKMPPKFKCPELSKYNGKGCPLAHLKLYIGSLSDFIDNEPLLLQLFQRSLTEEALDWYYTIDHTKLKVWRDLAKVFLDHFRFNTTDVANRMDVQRMYKKSTETFKQYAHRWRGVAAQVKPPMSETEMVSTFISTLKQPYYGYLLGYYASNFATIVHIEDGIDDVIKTGKLADYEYLHNMFEQQTAANATTKRPVNGRRDNGKKEGDVQTVMVNRPQNSYAQPMYTQPSYPVYGQPPQPNCPVYAQLPQPSYAQAVQPAQPAVVPPIGPSSPGNRAPNQSNEKKYRVFTKLPVRPSELLPTLLEGYIKEETAIHIKSSNSIQGKMPNLAGKNSHINALNSSDVSVDPRVKQPSCERCGRSHRTEDCKAGVCYQCGKPGHIKRHCPSLRQNSGNGGKGRIFAMTQEVQPGDDIVEGAL
ncbi:hypothetical protein HHK36_020064 [Tetracentron sinense]|uniref:CCHC-type domain-containing protein n=1 Tax=Tetracentron sinense TaxID=13715 RepID=A0A834YWG9_TETSI|nr:hypothetical protein HHK36_020064 [Tetracentron sinense]